jgi:hypothetical protein
VLPETWTEPQRCPAGSWSAGGTRSSSCTPCPPGLWEDEAVFNTTGVLRTSQDDVCSEWRNRLGIVCN